MNGDGYLQSTGMTEGLLGGRAANFSNYGVEYFSTAKYSVWEAVIVNGRGFGTACGSITTVEKAQYQGKTKFSRRIQLCNSLPTLVKLPDLCLVITTSGQESFFLISNSKYTRSKFLNPKQKLNDHKVCIHLPRDSSVST